MKALTKIILTGMCIVGVGYYANTQSKPQVSNFIQSNIEALADTEDDDCHYQNGYAAFTKHDGGAYDCCKVWVPRAPNTDEGRCR